MLSASKFRDLVSGRRRGVVARLLQFALRVVEIPYCTVVRWRNWRFDSGTAQSHRVGVPVVSVGNLTLGGTGKTPMVEWIARWYGEQGVRPAVISRGYGAKAGAQNDEALELAQKLPNVRHLQNPDRVAAARKAVEELDCQLIVLDDGFQHRRIARDLDVVMLDALEPFGFGHVFPRGMLREPIFALRRADVLALSRCDLLEPHERDEIWRLARRHAPDAVKLEVAHAPRALLSSSGREQPVESLRGEPVAAFCGLGNPTGFRHTLEACGFKVAEFREFPDHHRYGRDDVESLRNWAGGLDVTAVLCTHKDIVKLAVEELATRPLWALSVELKIVAGRDDFQSRLRELMPPV